MNTVKLFEAEWNLMEILWEEGPINSTKLVKEAEKTLGWKKSTTYTVVRKLGEKSALKNEGAMVTALLSKEEVLMQESSDFVSHYFDNSLPSFVAAFTRKKKLTKEEAEVLKKMIEEASYD